MLASEREVSLKNKQAIQAKKQDTLQKGKTLAAFHLDQIVCVLYIYTFNTVK